MLEKLTVAADDLAYAFQFTVPIQGDRGLGVTTSCPINSTLAEIRAVLRKMVDATTFIERLYDLQKLQRELSSTEKDYATHQLLKEDHVERARQEWDKRERFGPFQLTESQQAQLRNFETTQDGQINRIKLYRAQIAELEAAIKD
jgi:hypothetical protein